MDDQRANFLADAAPSRRRLLTGLGLGLAVAALPASASTLTTDARGLRVGEAAVPTPDGSIPGFYARPRRGRALPVVLVVQEIFGVHEHIRDVCRRLAHAGYLAVSVELFSRQGDTSVLPGIPEILEVVRRVPDAGVLADLDAAVAWASTLGGDTTRLGITGFCWGGRVVWLYAAHRAGLRAGVAWYGRLAGEPTPLQPAHPLDQVSALHAPVLGLYAGRDKGIPLADVERMQAALAAAGKPGEIVVYPDAEHGFHADYRPSYDEAAARDGVARMLAWFEAHGVR